MSTKAALSIASIFLVLGVVGCQPSQRGGPGVALTEATLTLEQLALRLGLRIAERDEAFVVLKNVANTVILFTHSNGRFFVNNKPGGAVGAVTEAGGTLYLSEALVPQIRRQLRTGSDEPSVVPGRRRGQLVVIDAGHGGRDPGAISPIGVEEKNINLRVAAKIARILEGRGLGVIMTRWQDTFIELEERAALANRRQADLFVSIHADSAPSASAQGFTIYVATAASSDARRAARAINRAMSQTDSESRGVREADYRVLVGTDGPAVLVELGYLTNPQEAARLTDDTFQNRLAQAIADGVATFLRR